MSVANQGPRAGSGTKQGHYIISPSGKLLGYNNNRDNWNRLKFINDALEKWAALPESETKPGAISVPVLDKSKLDPKYHAEVPEGGLALVASERILKRVDGNLAACTAEDHDHEWGHLAAVDRMWIQKDEWEQLLAVGKDGGSMPDRLAKRLIRYHLLDFTRGEPSAWNLDDVKVIDLKLKPLADTSFELSGKVLVSDDTRGFEADVSGKIEVDSQERATRFDMVVVGDHWGHSEFTGGSRPGKAPLGIAFQLGDLTKSEDRIRPQASHWLQGYWEAEKQF